MDLDWEKLFKRYVWHDEKTPYLTRVAHLTRAQVHYELFVYSMLMGVLFGVLSLATLSGKLPHGNAQIVPLYAFSVCCAALILGVTRHPWAALWCAGAPLAALGYLAMWGFHPNLESGDRIVLVVVVLGWLAYSRRLVAVARAWQKYDATA
jgi:hypothetical protein